MRNACSIRVRGIVQGVGFRPFVYRLAETHSLAGWVLNGDQGVEIFLEGEEPALRGFTQDLQTQLPPAARISEIDVKPVPLLGLDSFTIRPSESSDRPSVRISPDLPICAECLAEMSNPSDRRHLYPYINCTNCGPRYTIILGVPYDRPNTTLKDWPLDDYCEREYHDPANRRFHAQPVACPNCGPKYYIVEGDQMFREAVFERAAKRLNQGWILAMKGLGGYHLACDARNRDAVSALRERKFRKEKPFAVMTIDIETARSLAAVTPEDEALLNSVPRPIVLLKAKENLEGVAPDNDELGLMLPYTPAQHLLFRAGAPAALVMTSANRSSEPIAYEDDDALQSLSEIADAFLVGERPIARRVDDSVVRVSRGGPTILRRARGYAPGVVTNLPISRPLLAVGADLKNTITLVVEGQAFVSQHIGDLEHYDAFRAFGETIQDLVSMYDVPWQELLVVHDAHPQYLSTSHAHTLGAKEIRAVQHHRAHIASVLTERDEWERQIVGVSFDGTGYGDDGSIWGGEIFRGSIQQGFKRVAHLRTAALPGGDAAARNPVQAAAGFLNQIEDLPDLFANPFTFPALYRHALQLVQKNVRAFPTSSVGRLFDTAAALLGFTREITFEGQAAMWLEQLAREGLAPEPYPFPYLEPELDFRPLLYAVARDRLRGRKPQEIAASFHHGVAEGLTQCVTALCARDKIDTVVLSGGVFQNWLLVSQLVTLLEHRSLTVLTNHAVPPNDGGISLGQAALAAFSVFDDEMG